MLKRSWDCIPPLVEYIAIDQPASVQNSGNVAAGKGYDHVSAGLEYPRGGRSEMDRDPEGQSGGYDMTSFLTVTCHIAGMLALSCWKRKLFATV